MGRKDDRFPTDRLHEIADDVVEVFRDEEQVPKDAIVELGDGIPMWGLGLTGLWLPGLARLEEPAAFFLERWFHPIRCYGKPVAFAETSYTNDGNELYVPTIGFDARLTAMLLDARGATPDGVRLRLIDAPGLGHVQAIWMRDEKVGCSEVRVAPIEGRGEMRIGEADFIRFTARH